MPGTSSWPPCSACGSTRPGTTTSLSWPAGIPAREEKKFQTALDAIDAIEYSIESAEGDTHHTPPVTLRNARTFRPFEYFVDMYGLPRYNELDPTAFVAITFTLLFGIMFGDLGQGILVAVIGWAMWHFKQMPIGRILLPCGISSAVFGLVYGSVFGFEHVLDPMYKALFGLEEKAHRGHELRHGHQHHPVRGGHRLDPHHAGHDAQHLFRLQAAQL